MSRPASRWSAGFPSTRVFLPVAFVAAQQRLTFPVPGRPADDEEQPEWVSLSATGTRNFFFSEYNGRRPNYLQRLSSDSILSIDRGSRQYLAFSPEDDPVIPVYEWICLGPEDPFLRYGFIEIFHTFF